MARRRLGVKAPQIRPFANVDQISGSNYRSYIDSTAGSNLRSPALAALQIPGGYTVDEEISKIEVDAKSAEAILNDQSRRKPLQSPYRPRIESLEREFRSVASAVREQANRFVSQSGPQNKSPFGALLQSLPADDAPVSSEYLKSVRNLIQSNSYLLNTTDSRPAGGGASGRYMAQLDAIERRMPELEALRAESSRFDQQSNSGIVNPLSDQERASLQQQATTARNQIASINAAAAERLRNIATQFNDGTARAAAAIGDARRPLAGRFGTPATGVGIAIGGFR
jgi:hypothetical protein